MMEKNTITNARTMEDTKQFCLWKKESAITKYSRRVRVESTPALVAGGRRFETCSCNLCDVAKGETIWQSGTSKE